jgi:Tfp pilus assembly protein PilN
MEQQINLYQPILGAGNPIFSAQMVAAAIAVFALSLTGISGFAASRVRRVEQEVAGIENQDALRTAAAGRLLATLQPEGGLEALEARLKVIAADIDEQEQVLDAVRQGAADGVTGFSARLEALGRHQPDGLWLSRIVLSTGARQLALTGAANNPELVPAYLNALASERSLASSRFDRFQLRLPQDGEPEAATIFEVGTPASAPPAGSPRP